MGKLARINQRRSQMLRVIKFTSETRGHFRWMYEGYVTGPLVAQEGKKRDWDSDLSHEAKITRKIKKISSDTERLYRQGEALRELNEGDQTLELTNEQLTRVISYIKKTPWLASNADDVADTLDFLETSEKADEV
jgi:hypothetical protein